MSSISGIPAFRRPSVGGDSSIGDNVHQPNSSSTSLPMISNAGSRRQSGVPDEMDELKHDLLLRLMASYENYEQRRQEGRQSLLQKRKNQSKYGITAQSRDMAYLDQLQKEFMNYEKINGENQESSNLPTVEEANQYSPNNPTETNIHQATNDFRLPPVHYNQYQNTKNIPNYLSQSMPAGLDNLAETDTKTFDTHSHNDTHKGHNPIPDIETQEIETRTTPNQGADSPITTYNTEITPIPFGETKGHNRVKRKAIRLPPLLLPPVYSVPPRPLKHREFLTPTRVRGPITDTEWDELLQCRYLRHKASRRALAMNRQ